MRGRWSWSGAVALVLALSIGVGWVIGIVSALSDPDGLSPAGAALVYIIGGALVGGVVSWLGKRGNDDDERKTRDDGSR